jgi:hypothetical protein
MITAGGLATGVRRVHIDVAAAGLARLVRPKPHLESRVNRDREAGECPQGEVLIARQDLANPSWRNTHARGQVSPGELTLV